MQPKKIIPRKKSSKGEADNVVDVSTWPSRAEAAKELNCSLSTIKRWEEAGHLTPVQDRNGFWRFDPAELQEVRKEDGQQGLQLLGESMRTVVEGASGLTAQAQDHTQGLVGKLIEHTDKSFDKLVSTLEIQQEIIKDQKDRIKELEAERTETFKQDEQAKSKFHEREMERAKVEREEKRIDEALGLVTALIMPFVAKKFGMDLGAALKGGAAELPKPDEARTPEIEEISDAASELFMMVGNMEDQRFSTLIMVSTASEKAILVKARGVAEKMKKKSRSAAGQGEKENGEGRPAQG